MKETFRDRLRRLIPPRQMKRVSLASGQGETYVRDILSERSKNPKISGIIAIAAALDIDVREILYPSDYAFVEDDAGSEIIQIVKNLDPSDRSLALQLLRKVSSASSSQMTLMPPKPPSADSQS